MTDIDQIAEVYLEIKALGLDHAFDYKIPQEMTGKLNIGDAVSVPFKNRYETGYISRLKTKSGIPDENLKNIKRIISSIPIFNKQRLRLIHWMSFYYIQSVGKIIELFLPPGTKKNLNKLSNPEYFFKFDIFIYSSDKNLQQYIKEINIKKNYAKKKIFDFLIQNKEILKTGIEKKDFLIKSGISREFFKELLINNVLSTVKKRSGIDNERINFSVNNKINNKKSPITFQTNWLNTIKDLIGRNTFKCILMEGLEKNEKTGIYKELCLETTNKGKKVLILTPEILFAPVLFENIKDEFRGRTGLYHSGMSDSRRFEQWFNIFNNNYDILIGTRSALFTPLNDIGLVIIDEAEDPSYKENTIIRYNAQDIAIKLGRIFKIPVIYSSKTPAVSMKYKSLNDHNFMNVIIPESHKGVPPLIKESIDLKSVDKKREDLVITNELYKAVKQELEKNNKAIIFINKRGYSTFLLCRDCGYIPKCPSCNVSYRFHRSTKKLNCHQCGKEIIYDGNCINCGGDNISFQGTGIEKVESKLKTRFKNVPIIRIDTDSTKNTRLYNETIKKIRNTRAAILVGTQILARLQGVENITLVGIINCDNMLELPDYSINEKVYQLITNIVDKVDVNNKKTRVIIQSYNPDNIVIKNFTNGTYSDFYNAELANREELFYPPFSNLVNIIVSGKIENEVKTDALKIYNELSKIKNDIFKITGPSPAPFYKINLFYRWHILLKTGNLKILNLKLSRLMKTFKKNENNKIILDVDPVWIL